MNLGCVQRNYTSSGYVTWSKVGHGRCCAPLPICAKQDSCCGPIFTCCHTTEGSSISSFLLQTRFTIHSADVNNKCFVVVAVVAVVVVLTSTSYRQIRGCLLKEGYEIAKRVNSSTWCTVWPITKNDGSVVLLGAMRNCSSQDQGGAAKFAAVPIKWVAF